MSHASGRNVHEDIHAHALAGNEAVAALLIERMGARDLNAAARKRLGPAGSN